MVKFKNWKKKSDEPNYITWEYDDKRIGWFNRIFLVVKTEMGEWVVFLDGGEGGTKILARPKTKRESLKVARMYMMMNP
jgi:hypothetical protein